MHGLKKFKIWQIQINAAERINQVWSDERIRKNSNFCYYQTMVKKAAMLLSWLLPKESSR